MPHWLATLDHVYSRPGDFERYMAPSEFMIDYLAIRAHNIEYLASNDFSVAESLPLGPHDETTALRPIEEIAKCLWALNAAFSLC